MIIHASKVIYPQPKIWNARRGCLIFGSLLFTLAPVLTHFTLRLGVPAVCFSYGVVRISRQDLRRIECRVQTVFKFAFSSDGSRGHKHYYAPFNTHPCHMVSRTHRPGWYTPENPTFVSNWLTSKTKNYNRLSSRCWALSPQGLVSPPLYSLRFKLFSSTQTTWVLWR